MAITQHTYYNLIIAIALSVVAISCSNDFEKAVNLSENEAEQESTNTTITYTLDGRLISDVKAPLIQQFAGDSAVEEQLRMDQGFEATFYDSLQEVSSKIRADRGLWHKKSNLMNAYGNVVAYSVQGDTLFTEELIWDQDSAIIYTNAPVMIKKPNATIYGKGLVADQEFKSYTINSITGSVAIEKEEL